MAKRNLKTNELKAVNKDRKGFIQEVFKSSNSMMYLLLLPAIIATFIFNYLPLSGIVIAFKDFDAISGIIDSPWVGLQNFKTVLTMPSFLEAIGNTLLYSAVSLFGTFPFPIILALLFNEVLNTKFKKVVQTVSYFPHFLSWAAVCGFVYSVFGMDGAFNDIMVAIFGEGYERTNILFKSENFLPVMFFSGLWKGVGWSSILYLAAITGIDSTLYEAAEIDGCNRLQKVWYITLPCIKTTIVLVLILGVGGIVKTNFEQVYGLQNVYIQQETEVIDTLTYRQGIQGGEYSLATAFGLMQAVVSLIIVTAANKFSKRVADVGLW